MARWDDVSGSSLPEGGGVLCVWGQLSQRCPVTSLGSWLFRSLDPPYPRTPTALVTALLTSRGSRSTCLGSASPVVLGQTGAPRLRTRVLAGKNRRTENSGPGTAPSALLDPGQQSRDAGAEPFPFSREAAEALHHSAGTRVLRGTDGLLPGVGRERGLRGGSCGRGPEWVWGGLCSPWASGRFAADWTVSAG